MYGRGDILRIDLSTGEVTREPLSEELRRKYVGGEGINTRLFWEHFLKVDPRIDPISPDNVIIWGLGPLGATSYGGGSKSRWTFKGPAYGMFADTTSGGAFGGQMRWAGYDHLVITGRASRPVYIWINDDHVEIRDAGKIWGKKVDESNEVIRKELGNDLVETACIGPAGENMVTFASITVSGDRSAGRTGGGCVFGSKNLKAIAALGTKGISVYNRKAFLKAMDTLMAVMYDPREHLVGFDRNYFMKYGTLGIIARINELGWHAYRNGQRGQTPYIDQLNAQWYFDNMQDRRYACSPSCAAACQTWHHIKGTESPLAKRYIGEYGQRPEFGTAVPFGVCCDVPDLPAVSHMTVATNQYGMDIFEVGMGISFMMELWQRGIITGEDVEGWTGEPLSLEWGNVEAMEKLIDSIALQNNPMGRILSRGVYRAAQRIEEIKGIPVLQYAAYGKGGATHEGSMRSRPQLSLAAAVSAIGCHHLKGAGIDEGTSMRFLGKPDASDPWSYSLKGAGQALAETFSCIYNSIGVCKFAGATIRNCAEFPPELYIPALYALTGEEFTAEEFLAAGERIANLHKAFNSRLGLRREDDALCYRWMNEPMTDGPGKGMKAADFLERAKDEYYEYHGWDKATSLQKREKLVELGLEDVIEVLEGEGAIATLEEAKILIEQWRREYN